MRLRAMVLSAAITGLSLTLPMVFHAVGLGNKFLPLLLPLLVAGFLLPPRWALLTGTLAPLLSAVLTGMPPLYPPIALALAAEGAVLGGTASLIYGAGRRNLWLALIPAVLAGRLTALLATWWIARTVGLPGGLAAATVVVQGLPGVALQLVATPIAVSQLRRRSGPLFQFENEPEA